MGLYLKVLRFGDNVVENDLCVTIGIAGGSIGRATGNDLVLPDKEGYVSRVHAKIENDGGTFFVLDCSSNGTLLLEPIEGGAEDEFSEISIHGDKKPIRDGGYIIIGEFEISAQYCDDSVLADSHGQDVLEQPVFSKSSVAQQKQEIHETESIVNVSALQSSISIPEAKQDPGVKDEIPEAFDIESFFPEDGGVSEKQEEDDILSGLEDPMVDEDVAKKPAEPSHEASASEAALDLRKSTLSDNGIVDVQNDLSPSVDSMGDKPPEKSYKREADSQLQTQSIESTDRVSSEQIGQKKEGKNTFYKALGIDILKLPDNEVELDQLMFRAGKMLRTLLESNMSLLKARADVKRGFSTSMTVVKKEENNPLKFCQSVDEALPYLLFENSPGFLSGQLAVDESSHDLCAHQMSMMSGIQGALQAAMKKFDPVILEGCCEVGHFNKSSKFWDYYVNNYKKLSKEAQTEFFGSDFAEAYERQARAMKNSR